MSYANNQVELVAGGAMLVLPATNGRLRDILRIAVTAAAATSTIEVFDGAIGVVDAVGDTSIGAAGTNYEVGDLITLDPGNGGTPLILEVATVDAGGEVLTYTISQVGTGLATGNTQATTTNSVAGADFTIDIDTVSDTGVSKGKVSVVANTTQELEICHQASDEVSVRVTGASAQGYLYHK